MVSEGTIYVCHMNLSLKWVISKEHSVKYLLYLNRSKKDNSNPEKVLGPYTDSINSNLLDLGFHFGWCMVEWITAIACNAMPLRTCNYGYLLDDIRIPLSYHLIDTSSVVSIHGNIVHGKSLDICELTYFIAS